MLFFYEVKIIFYSKCLNRRSDGSVVKSPTTFPNGETPEIPAFLFKFDLLYITITPEVIVVLRNGRDIV
jgi:hypothetical protein